MPMLYVQAMEHLTMKKLTDLKKKRSDFKGILLGETEQHTNDE